MSLLNDALRKKTNENKSKETAYSDRSQTALHNVKGGKISRLCGFPLLLGSLVFGAWYFWGSLSAQMGSPMVASSISKDIEINESDLLSEPTEDAKKIVAPKPDILKPIGEITPVEAVVEIDTIVRTDPPAKLHHEQVAPSPPKKAEKNPRIAKKKGAVSGGSEDGRQSLTFTPGSPFSSKGAPLPPTGQF